MAPKVVNLLFFIQLWSFIAFAATRQYTSCKITCQNDIACVAMKKITPLLNQDCKMLKLPDHSDAELLNISLSVSSQRLLTFKWNYLGSTKVYVLMLLFYDSHGEEVTQSRRCYVVNSRRRQQIQGSLTCQMYRQFHNVTAVLYVKQDRTRRDKIGLTSFVYKQPVIAPANKIAFEDKNCQQWKLNDFYTEPDLVKRTITVKWETTKTHFFVEVGLVTKDHKDIFYRFKKLLMDSKSVTFQNISSGIYHALIRPVTGRCQVNFISSAPLNFQPPQAQTVHVTPVTEVSRRKTTNSDLLWWMLLVVPLSFFAIILLFCMIYRNKNNQYKQAGGWKRNFSRTQRVVLVYCSDCEEHLEAVLQLVKLLKKMVSEVIYPDDPNLLSAVKENTVLWADNQARCDYNTVFVIVYSQLLHQLYKAMSADENTFRIISNNNPDPFKDIAPHLLQNLKTKHNVILVNLGYRQLSPASALHSISCKHFVLTKDSSSAGSRKRQMTIEELLTWFGVSGGKNSFVDSEEEKCFCESVDRVHQFMENNPQWFEHTFLNP